MDDTLIKLQELVEYQREDIASLSAELYIQQKEVAKLKKQMLKLHDKIQGIENNRSAAGSSDEPPPPHY